MHQPSLALVANMVKTGYMLYMNPGLMGKVI